MIRKSTAVWTGDGLHGKGALTTQSGIASIIPSVKGSASSSAHQETLAKINVSTTPTSV